jgi:hypothetical protein
MGKLLEKKRDCPCAALTSFYAIWDLPWAAPGHKYAIAIIPLILKRDLRDLECDRQQPQDWPTYAEIGAGVSGKESVEHPHPGCPKLRN